MALSSITIVGNNYLEQRAIDANARNIQLIPTVVDILKYSVKRKASPDLVVGWIGSPTTQKYIIDLLPVFVRLSKNFDFELHLVGATKETVNSMPGIAIKLFPWSESTEVERIQQMDIGIMPLTDGPWERGKCGYKLIQYMACGIPVVASNVGVNFDIVNGSKSGSLVEDECGWFTALSELLNDRHLRLSLGENGRTAVQNKYSVQTQWRRVSKIMKQCVGLRTK
ncbi:glycosyltransferase [Vibrio inusitatus]|nr:glycosyltransferase [Vibrio inusitatus]